MSNLAELLQRARAQYSSRKISAEAAVVRWEYHTNTAHDPRPYFCERYNLMLGRRIAKPRSNAFQYGLDELDRCVVVRQPKTKDEPAFEEFFSYRAAGADSAAYRASADHALCYVTQQKLRGGKLLACDVLDADKSAQEVRERYRYRPDGQLQDVAVEILQRGKRVEEHRFDVMYDSRGRMIAVRRYWPHLERFLPIHWNEKTAPSAAEMATEIRCRLLQLVPDAVAKAKVKSRVYCLAVTYDTSEDELPPKLAIGLEEDLEKLRASNPAAVKKEAWNPKRFSRYQPGSVPLAEDPTFLMQCDLFMQHTMAKSDMASPRRLLNEVSMKLNARRDWARRLPVMQNFVVYVVDLDDELREMYLARNLKESVPLATLKELRRRKLA